MKLPNLGFNVRTVAFNVPADVVVQVPGERARLITPPVSSLPTVLNTRGHGDVHAGKGGSARPGCSTARESNGVSETSSQVAESTFIDNLTPSTQGCTPQLFGRTYLNPWHHKHPLVWAVDIRCVWGAAPPL